MIPNDSLGDTLRPSFTAKVIGWLERGKAINIIGEEGQGIGRLTEDLQKGCPPDVKLVRLSMRSFAASYAGFLQALADALDLKKMPGADIRLLLNNFLRASGQTIWLCLEHFDPLAEKQVDDKNVDVAGYDINFLNYLNSMRDLPKVSLLVCSQVEIRATELYIGGKPVSGSRLEFSERIPLSSLTFAEIEAYLARRMPDSAQKATLFAQKPPFYTELITEIDAHPESVLFADFVAGQSMDAGWNLGAFQDRLRFWKKEYARLHAPTFDRRIGQIEQETRRWKHRTDRFFGLSKLWRSIGLKMKIAFAICISLALGGWKWVEQAWAFCATFLHK